MQRLRRSLYCRRGRIMYQGFNNTRCAPDDIAHHRACRRLPFAVKAAAAAGFILIALLFLSVDAFAYELPSVDETIPEEVKKYLPESLYCPVGPAETAKSINADEVLKYLFDVAGASLKSVIAPFFTLTGIVLLCSVFHNYSEISTGDSVKKVYGFLSSLCIGTSLASILTGIWNAASQLADKLTSLVTASSATLVTVYTVSGNVNGAAVSASNMAVFTAVLENVFKYGLFPVLQICFSFCFVSAVTDIADLTSLARLIRKSYTTVLVFIMGVLTTVLSVQHVLASKADGMLVRGVKMAAGSFIPIVGNAIGEASRTVAAGLGALKGTLGIICVIALAVCVLPVIIKMLITKLTLLMCAVFADLVGLKREAAFIRSGGELINFTVALLSSVSLVFVINLMIFAGSASVAGG